MSESPRPQPDLAVTPGPAPTDHGAQPDPAPPEAARSRFRLPWRAARSQDDVPPAASAEAPAVPAAEAAPARGRIPWHKVGLAKRETRVGVAALLSFLILVGVWTTNKLRHPAASSHDPAGTGAALAAKPEQHAPAPAAAPDPDPSPPAPARPAPEETSPIRTVAAQVPLDTEPAQPIPVAEAVPVAESTPAPAEPVPPATTAQANETPPAQPEVAAVPPLGDGASHPPPAAPEPAQPVPAPVTEPKPEPAALAALPPLVGDPGAPPAPAAEPKPAPKPDAAPTPPAPVVAAAPTPPAPEPAAPPQAAPEPIAAAPMPTAPEPAPAPAAQVADNPPPEPAPKPIPTFAPAPSSAPPPAALPAASGDRIPLPNAGKVILTLDQPLGAAPRRRVAVTVAATRPAVPVPAPARSRVEAVSHVVQSGENFWTISKLYYGKGRYYKALWKANNDRVPAPDQLVVGTALRIPPPEELDRTLIDPVGDDQPPGPRDNLASRRDAQTTRAGKPGDTLLMLPVSGEPPGRTRNVPVEAEKVRPFHVVRNHETLRTIARDTLGDPRRADEILELNRDVLGGPSELARGMRLRLPADAESVRR